MILALCFYFLYCTGIFDGRLLTSNTAYILERKDKYRQGFYSLDTQDCDSNHLKRSTLRNGSPSPMPKNQCSQITQPYKFNVHAAQQTGCSVSRFTRFSLKHSQSVQLILWPLRLPGSFPQFAKHWCSAEVQNLFSVMDSSASLTSPQKRRGVRLWRKSITSKCLDNSENMLRNEIHDPVTNRPHYQCIKCKL